MAFEPGGISDKLGNRFEQRWVARQMLRVLAGRLLVVQHEAIGDDERGVDLWVTRLDGTREAQQCKGSYGTRSSLSVADMDRMGILRALDFQLSRNRMRAFTFISSVPAPLFKDLTESARLNAGTGAEFRTQLEARSERHRKALARFCDALHIDEQSEEGLTRALDLLRRSSFSHFADDSEHEENLRLWSQLLVEGDPQAVIATLQDLAIGTLRTPLNDARIAAHLADVGFSCKLVDGDKRLFQRFEALNRAHTDQMRGHLIGGRLISRAETDIVLESVLKPIEMGHCIIALEGAAGAGKSAVLLEVAERMREESVTYLVLRLDRQHPRGSARLYGNSIDLADAPTLCVSKAAGDRIGVLILDQLDATGSSRAHAGDAWSVCREMFRQAKLLGNVRIVVACRSFELNHDPQFRAWAGSSDLTRVAVGSLSVEDVEAVVSSTGSNIATLRPQVVSLLRRPQHLLMWLDLPSTDHAIESPPELLGAFWRHHFAEITRRGISSSALETAVAKCVRFLEESGGTVVPLRIVEEHAAAIQALNSQGLFDSAAPGVAFSHQSYLDYQIARRALASLDMGHSIRDWLNSGQGQTLARREQVRHLLGMMRLEDPRRYLATVAEILRDAQLRFHIRLLTLQVFGTAGTPSDEDGELAVSLLHEDEWREHALSHVFARRPAWLAFLDRDGILAAWLDSDVQTEVNEAAWLLKGIAPLDGDLVARLLRTRLGRPGGALLAGAVLPFHAHEDTDELFRVRLEVIAESERPDHVSWKQLAANRPDRCWPLLGAHLKRLVSKALEREGAPRVELRGFDQLLAEHDVVELEGAARRCATALWGTTLACLEELDREEWSCGSSEAPWVKNYLIELPEHLESLVRMAGEAFCQQDTAEFLRQLPRSSAIRSAGWLRSVAAGLVAGPDEIADAALQWLMDDPARLRLGNRFEEEQWRPAQRVIARHSRICSDEMYRKFEAFVLNHHDSDEWRSMRARLSVDGSSSNKAPNRYGQGQLFLLGSLSSDRLSAEAAGTLGVLRKKFARVGPLFFGRVATTGVHRVRSPVSPDRLSRLSDRTLLKILTRDPAILRSRRGGWRIGDFTESTVEAFAADLHLAAGKDPPRFARLLLTMPASVPPAYREAILAALVHPRPPYAMSPQDQASWRAASGDTLVSVLERCDTTTVSSAMSFCRIVRNHDDVTWSDTVVDRLVQLATSHAHPERDELPIGRSSQAEDGLEQLESSALNCVRGAAAHAVATLLFRGAKWLGTLYPAVDALVADGNPAVRVAAIETLLPILNYDSELATELFLRCTTGSDDLVLACHGAWTFFSFASRSHLKKLEPVLDRMMASSEGAVARRGAAAVAAAWIRDGELKETLEACLRRGANHREGLAQAAATASAELDWIDACLELLVRLVNDEHRGVRDEVSRVFHRLRDLKRAPVAQFAAAYVRSRTFRDSPSPLVYAIQKLEGDLTALSDVLLAVCNVFAGELASQSRDWSASIAGDARAVGPLLLRLHEQARSNGDRTLVERTLDMWDELLRQRVGDAEAVLADFEA